MALDEAVSPTLVSDILAALSGKTLDVVQVLSVLKGSYPALTKKDVNSHLYKLKNKSVRQVCGFEARPLWTVC